MTQAPPSASESAQLPTIIIDPSLYEADAPQPKQTPSAALGRLARVTLLTSAVGGVTVGFAHLLWSDSFSHDVGVAPLTKMLTQADHHAASQLRSDESPSASLAKPVKSAAPAQPSAEAAPSPEAPARPVAAVPDPLASSTLVAPESGLAAAVHASVPAPAPQQPELVIAQPLAGSKRPLGASVTQSAKSARLDLETSIRNARRLQALNQFEEAEAAYLAVLAQSAEQSAALIGLARINLARGQLDAALDFARRAALQTPDQPNIHLTLGDILRARGDQQGAQAEFALAK